MADSSITSDQGKIRRWHISLNIVAVLLLGAIAIGVYSIPRFNYQAIVSKQEVLSKQLGVLHHKITSIPTSGANMQASVLSVKQLRDDLAELRALLSSMTARQAQEGDLANQAIDTRESPNRRVAYSSSYTEPIELPAELRQLASQLPGELVLQVEFPQVLERLLELGILKGESVGSLPERDLERAHEIFDLFGSNLKLIQAEQQQFLEEEISKATEAGDYIEVPLDSTIKQPPIQTGKGGVVLVREVAELGVQRRFEFPRGKYPELEYLSEARRNARDHFVQDIVKILSP